MSKESKTVVLTARINEVDREQILSFAKSFGTLQAGFSEVAKRIQAEPEKIEVYVEKNIEQVFEFASYQLFKLPMDTHPSDAIKRGLEYANEAKLNESIEKQTPVTSLQTGHLLEFNDEMNENIIKLRRVLKSQGKIPKEWTDKEFLEKLCTQLLQKHIDKNYEYLNKN